MLRQHGGQAVPLALKVRRVEPQVDDAGLREPLAEYQLAEVAVIGDDDAPFAVGYREDLAVGDSVAPRSAISRV